jgi:hypothetical protein
VLFAAASAAAAATATCCPRCCCCCCLLTGVLSQGDLFDDLKQRTSTSSEHKVVSEVLAPFMSALLYLHVQKDVIHRDIKPENIVFTANRTVKLAGTLRRKVCRAQDGSLHHRQHADTTSAMADATRTFLAEALGSWAASHKRVCCRNGAAVSSDP